ncbi:hypothetical protein [Nostoc sp. FACHB-145]|uniref:hypothetical protein n=1 Tax=Nostoc sp. FACHB-145 TaxID=2692836 RepID=UPI001685DE6E|nr:hypothetical protein [Nostoc sp. FACHB-145]MBD2472010.1 hypothetical protein [Nostoc sp. FACHB-145]
MVKVKRRLSEPNPIDPNLTSAQIEMEKLEAWIRNFVFSFELSKLRSILANAKFLHKPIGAWQVNPLKVLSGLAVFITCDSWKDYRQLVAKNKQLAYRIRKLDPEVDLLMLLSPDETIVEVTVIATFERFTLDRLIKAIFGEQPQVRVYTHPHRLAADQPSLGK